jgi:L-2,4-diaminobutyrate decarboxylase
MFDTDFISARHDSVEAYEHAIRQAVSTLLSALPGRPCSGRTPAELGAVADAAPLGDADGQPLAVALRGVEDVVRHSVAVSHPWVAAHLHCPPLIPALAAEVVLSALNQSMDSFDQAPAATAVEQSLTAWLCREAGLPAAAAGTFTVGGTQSNYMGLLLARDAFAARRGWDARRDGLPPEAPRFRILCSEAAHFTVEKSVAQLGLGVGAVVKVAVDDDFRMDPRALTADLAVLRRRDLLPIAVVATAGTTDFGSIDPLPEVAELAHAAGAWLHVDAAYGGALLFSPRHRGKLRGLEWADSLGLDGHKLLWQPAGCGVFLLRDAAHLDLMRLHADYLNPVGHETLGIPDLVTRSLLTTRRFDALKLWLTLRTLGRTKLAAMIDRTLDLAAEAAALVTEEPQLELLHRPEMGCVVFRYRPSESGDDADALNEELPRRLWRAGKAVIGHTRVRGRNCLKLTFLNPTAERRQVAELVRLIVSEGRAAEADARGPATPGAEAAAAA